jgi:hypothetical protein
MSGFGGEAEILCSTRALPVLTHLRHGRLSIVAVHNAIQEVETATVEAAQSAVQIRDKAL